MTKDSKTNKYEPLHVPSLVMQIFFGLRFLLTFAALGAYFIDINTIADGMTADDLMSTKLDRLTGPAGEIVYYIAGGALILWLRRAFRNLRALNVTDLKSKEWYCIWGWFVPIANLFTPPTVTQEVWKASTPETLDSVEWKKQKGSKLVIGWWTTFLAFSIPNLIKLLLETFSSENTNRILEVLDSPVIIVGQQVSYLLSIILLVLVVRDVTKRQSQKHERLSKSVEIDQDTK